MWWGHTTSGRAAPSGPAIIRSRQTAQFSRSRGRLRTAAFQPRDHTIYCDSRPIYLKIAHYIPAITCEDLQRAVAERLGCAPVCKTRGSHGLDTLPHPLSKKLRAALGKPYGRISDTPFSGEGADFGDCRYAGRSRQFANRRRSKWEFAGESYTCAQATHLSVRLAESTDHRSPRAIRTVALERGHEPVTI